jgi:hypothetical protein
LGNTQIKRQRERHKTNREKERERKRNRMKGRLIIKDYIEQNYGDCKIKDQEYKADF